MLFHLSINAQDVRVFDKTQKTKVPQCNQSFLSKWKFSLEPGVTNVDFTNSSLGWSNNFKVNGNPHPVRAQLDFYDSYKNYLKLGDLQLTDQANHYFITVEHQKSNITGTVGIVHDKASLNDGNTSYKLGYGGQNLVFLIGYRHSFQLKQRFVGFNVYGRGGGFLSHNNIWIKVPFSKSRMMYSHLPRIGHRTFSGYGTTAQLGAEFSLKTKWSFGISLGILFNFQVGLTRTTAPIINTKLLPVDFQLTEPHTAFEMSPYTVGQASARLTYGMLSFGPYLNINIGN